jgi:hypothetical protein
MHSASYFVYVRRYDGSAASLRCHGAGTCTRTGSRSPEARLRRTSQSHSSWTDFQRTVPSTPWLLQLVTASVVNPAWPDCAPCRSQQIADLHRQALYPRRPALPKTPRSRSETPTLS